VTERDAHGTIWIMTTVTRLPETQTIRQTLAKILPALLDEQPVQLAYLYGSTSTGQTHRWSDIDIGLVFDPAAPLDDYQRFMLTITLEAELEQQYKLSNCEVRRIDDAPLRVQGKVVTEGMLLYSSNEAFRVAYEVQVRHEYFDFLPVLMYLCEAYFTQALAYLNGDKAGAAMFDPLKVQSILTNLDGYVDELRELAQLKQADFLASSVRLNATKYCLQTAVECCIDLNNHLIASMAFRSPENYADTFVVLAEQGIIDELFVMTARQMVSVRNRLVHLYWAVDNARLYDILQKNLDDFAQYKAFIVKYVTSYKK